MRCLGDVERLDSRLAALAREESALRLRLGQLLEVLGRGGVFELGFSSLGAYAVERCERSVRWAEGARCLARRLEALPRLRRRVACGEVSWSMAELLARVATGADEARWLELAEGRTIRQVRVLVAQALAVSNERAVDREASAEPEMAAECEAAAECEPAAASIRRPDAARTVRDVAAELASLHGDGAAEVCTLTCTVDREDAWLFEATRCLLEQLGERGLAAQSEALLAEAQGTLLALLPDSAAVVDSAAAVDSAAVADGARQRWLEQLRRWREEAEVVCEKNVLCTLRSVAGAPTAGAGGRLEVGQEAAFGMGPLERVSCGPLDARVRALAEALCTHELELSSLSLRFHRADGWRRLGYATEAQYARERLGLSRSSLRSRRTLALRLEQLPGVAAALGAARIGVEAALQLVRIATPRTEAAWIARAQRRTIKHLREEVAAARVAVRLAGEPECEPPEEAEMAAYQMLEQAVVSGRFDTTRAGSGGPGASTMSGAESSRPLAEPACGARRAWGVMLGSLTSWLASGLQTSAAAAGAPVARSAGRVVVRLRMSRDTYWWWRGLEAQARRWLPRGMSWLRFLCLSVWHAWSHLLRTNVAYGHIYIRDRFRCASPVCGRRDVTPHHIVFRSAGGSDAAHNIVSVCLWCHLHGVHGGRLRVAGRAERLRWELGPRCSPSLVVLGREREVCMKAA